MDLLIKLLKNGLKFNIVVGFLVGLVWAGQPAHSQVLATSYAVMDIESGEMLREKNSTEVRSIASITKLMTAMVVLDSQQDLKELIRIEPIKHISTKLRPGILVTRETLLHIALMSSDNLAAKTLAIQYPGGEEAFVLKMNEKARSLGMVNSEFTEPTGLLDTNISTAQDLIKLVTHASNYGLIREYSTSEHTEISVSNKKKKSLVNFGPTNMLVKKYKDIIISKTGWIRKSGGCLIMLVQNQTRKQAIIVLNSRNTRTRILDGDLLYGMYNNGKNI